MSGAYSPSPQYFGAASGSDLEQIHSGMLDDLGTAYNVEPDSYIWTYALTYARAMQAMWSMNQRLANQWTAAMLTDFLPRWEAILGLSSEGNDVQRRARVAAKFLSFGSIPTQTAVSDLMDLILGDDVYVGLVNVAPEDGYGSVPGGAVIPGGAILADDDFRANTGYIGILVSQPDAMSDDELYATVAQVGEFLDGFLPAWIDFAWIRNHSGLGEGFYLDQFENLDNDYFLP